MASLGKIHTGLALIFITIYRCRFYIPLAMIHLGVMAWSPTKLVVLVDWILTPHLMDQLMEWRTLAGDAAIHVNRGFTVAQKMASVKTGGLAL